MGTEIKMAPVPVVYQDDFDADTQQAYRELCEHFDTVNDRLLCWALVDASGNVQPWRLIIGRYGPCWQHMHNHGKFAGAFENEAKLAKQTDGLREVIVAMPVAVNTVVLKDGHLGMTVRRAG